MANVLKKEPGDIGRDEVIDFLKNAGVRGWSDKNFNERLMSFCSNYKLRKLQVQVEHFGKVEQ